MNDLEQFGKLIEIMDKLRSPDGCPWDREQSWESLRGYLLEECHEAIEALDSGDRDALCEELGDMLFQVVFLARLGQEEGRFTARDVIRGISEKMIRRHPHVFGDEKVADSDEVLRNWERIKQQEKAGNPSAAQGLLERLPAGLPALLAAHRLGEKAARVGFDWPGPAPVLEKIREETAEIESALAQGDREGALEELGDLLFATAMLARKLGQDPEQALAQANRKFRRRFREVEKRAEAEGAAVADLSSEALDRVWSAVKLAERQADG